MQHSSLTREAFKVKLFNLKNILSILSATEKQLKKELELYKPLWTRMRMELDLTAGSLVDSGQAISHRQSGCCGKVSSYW